MTRAIWRVGDPNSPIFTLPKGIAGFVLQHPSKQPEGLVLSMGHIGKLNTLGVEFCVIIFAVKIESGVHRRPAFYKEIERCFLFHLKHRRLSHSRGGGRAAWSSERVGVRDMLDKARDQTGRATRFLHYLD